MQNSSECVKNENTGGAAIRTGICKECCLQAGLSV